VDWGLDDRQGEYPKGKRCRGAAIQLCLGNTLPVTGVWKLRIRSVVRGSSGCITWRACAGGSKEFAASNLAVCSSLYLVIVSFHSCLHACEAACRATSPCSSQNCFIDIAYFHAPVRSNPSNHPRGYVNSNLVFAQITKQIRFCADLSTTINKCP
ncbi:Hypothetical protein, putative, partial [Bodo saltans]